jgi:hypothetical protein
MTEARFPDVVSGPDREHRVALAALEPSPRLPKALRTRASRWGSTSTSRCWQQSPALDVFRPLPTFSPIRLDRSGIQNERHCGGEKIEIVVAETAEQGAEHRETDPDIQKSSGRKQERYPYPSKPRNRGSQTILRSLGGSKDTHPAQDTGLPVPPRPPLGAHKQHRCQKPQSDRHWPGMCRDGNLSWGCYTDDNKQREVAQSEFALERGFGRPVQGRIP